MRKGLTKGWMVAKRYVTRPKKPCVSRTSESLSFLPTVKFLSRNKSISGWLVSYPYADQVSTLLHEREAASTMMKPILMHPVADDGPVSCAVRRIF